MSTAAHPLLPRSLYWWMYLKKRVRSHNSTRRTAVLLFPPTLPIRKKINSAREFNDEVELYVCAEYQGSYYGNQGLNASFAPEGVIFNTADNVPKGHARSLLRTPLASLLRGNTRRTLAHVRWKWTIFPVTYSEMMRFSEFLGNVWKDRELFVWHWFRDILTRVGSCGGWRAGYAPPNRIGCQLYAAVDLLLLR